MSNLFLFSTEMAQINSDDPEISELDSGLRAAFVAIQDIATGFPVYSGATGADKLYKDTHPKEIVAAEPINYGQLLNVYFDGDTPKVRLATATDKDRFANSIALSQAGTNSLVTCAVRTAALPIIGQGAAFLSAIPGALTNTVPQNAEILQKVGDYTTEHFQFYFHTPALMSFIPHNYLNRSI